MVQARVRAVPEEPAGRAADPVALLVAVKPLAVSCHLVTFPSLHRLVLPTIPGRARTDRPGVVRIEGYIIIII